MDKLHRQNLKHDKFVEQVGHSMEFATEHRSQVVRYGGIGLAVVVIAFAIYFYRDHQASVRDEALREALRVQQAQIGPGDNEYVKTFPTQAEKDKAVEKAFTEIDSKYSGSREASVADFYLGTMYADAGKTAEAEKAWRKVIDSGDKLLASQAKFSLAQLYAGEGKTADAEKLFRDLMSNPSLMVSKEQAAISLARALAPSNPAESRKLLEPLRTQTGAVSKTAITALSELPR